MRGLFSCILIALTVILHFFLFSIDTALGWPTFLSPQQQKKAEIHPWVGVLTVRSGNADFATGLILIADRLATANSNDISKLDKKTLRISSKAIFFKHNAPWSCDVKDYQIHPEFNSITLKNTLAILTLDCDRQDWSPVNLPVHTPTNMNQTKSNSKIWRNIYAVRLSDRHHDFEQIIFRMKFVKSSECLDFYVREEIDYKPLWPKRFLCFKAVDVKKKCVFDSGMALVSLNNGSWTLIGMSMLGPGCILPSRYIEIFPYMTWMNGLKNKHMLSYRRQLIFSDENENIERKKTAIDPSKNIINDVIQKEDDFYVEKLSQSSMVLRPNLADVRGIVHGDCLNNQGIIMYRDAGLVRTSKGLSTGVYALSLYDLFFENITCVMVSVKCDARSLTKFWYEKGFKTDSLDDIIYTVPHHKRGQTVPPKILFLRDTFYHYERIRTTNLVFKFAFTGEAAISVDFYGTLYTTTPRTTTTNTKKAQITTTSRPRRTYPRYHLQNTRRRDRRRRNRRR